MLATMAGISNPYLSQIERGLRAPSDQVLHAIADSLQDFYGRDAATYSGTTLPTPAAPTGVTRTYNSFSQMCHEIVDARVWSGIHFPFADEEAAKLGRRVAHWGTRHAFR